MTYTYKNRISIEPEQEPIEVAAELITAREYDEETGEPTENRRFSIKELEEIALFIETFVHGRED